MMPRTPTPRVLNVRRRLSRIDLRVLKLVLDTLTRPFNALPTGSLLTFCLTIYFLIVSFEELP